MLGRRRRLAGEHGRLGGTAGGRRRDFPLWGGRAREGGFGRVGRSRAPAVSMPQFTKASRAAAASAKRKKREAANKKRAATRAKNVASGAAGTGRNLKTPRLTAAIARTMVEGTAFSSGRTSSIVLSHGHRQVRDAHARSQAPKKPTRTPRGRALASIDTNASGAGAVVRAGRSAGGARRPSHSTLLVRTAQHGGISDRDCLWCCLQHRMEGRRSVDVRGAALGLGMGWQWTQGFERYQSHPMDRGLISWKPQPQPHQLVSMASLRTTSSQLRSWTRPPHLAHKMSAPQARRMSSVRPR